jgi:cell wall-associated NlpC family hydrolase
MKHSEVNWPKLVKLGKALVGTPYVFGAEIDLNNPDTSEIKGIDCSEVSEFLFHQIGIYLPDGSYNQAKIIKRLNIDPPTSKECVLVGDLGFKWYPETEVIHHVGIYIGNQTVLEAKGKSWGTILTPCYEYTASSHFAFWGRHKDIEDA